MNTRPLSDDPSVVYSSLEEHTHNFNEQPAHTPSSRRQTSVTNANRQQMTTDIDIWSRNDEMIARSELRSIRSASPTTTTTTTTTATTLSSSSTISEEEDVMPVETDLYRKNSAYDDNVMNPRSFMDMFGSVSDSSMDWVVSRGIRQPQCAGNDDMDVGREGYQRNAQQKLEEKTAEILHNDFQQEQVMLLALDEKNENLFSTDMFAGSAKQQCAAEVPVESQPVVEEKKELGTSASKGVCNERMMFHRPVDPRNLIINFIINSAPGSVTLQSVHDALQWDKNFEATNGSVLDYLQGYHSIFAVSPIDDRVTLRRSLQTVKGRRTVRGQRGYHAISSRIGSISYSYVATAFDLDMFSTIYKRRGYEVELIYDVLHVFSQRVFDLFLFSNGVVVWWGLNRPDHWVVDDDFLSSAHSFVREAVKERHDQTIINNMFPFWCSFELDEHYDTSKASCRSDALKRFAINLCFDHYLIPEVEPIRTQVMMTVSYSLGRTAIIDFFDFVTQGLQKQVLSISSGIKGITDYFFTRRQIAQIEGELQLARMAVMSIRDTPEFLWEMAWLYDHYALAESQNGSEQLFFWFITKSDALLQQLVNIKTRRYRLFMLGSDVFLILLLIIDVIFIMSSFVLKLYFPLEETE